VTAAAVASVASAVAVAVAASVVSVVVAAAVKVSSAASAATVAVVDDAAAGMCVSAVVGPTHCDCERRVAYCMGRIRMLRRLRGVSMSILAPGVSAGALLSGRWLSVGALERLFMSNSTACCPVDVAAAGRVPVLLAMLATPAVFATPRPAVLTACPLRPAAVAVGPAPLSSVASGLSL
jgi:hypothetical protein